ncbi:helix-turn-helix domain-containing protein [Saccharopolyspora sp. NPDC000995]
MVRASSKAASGNRGSVTGAVFPELVVIDRELRVVIFVGLACALVCGTRGGYRLRRRRICGAGWSRLFHGGTSRVEAARVFAVAPRSVPRWVQAWRKQCSKGLTGYRRGRRPGEQKAWSARQQRKLRYAVAEHPSGVRAGQPGVDPQDGGRADPGAARHRVEPDHSRKCLHPLANRDVQRLTRVVSSSRSSPATRSHTVARGHRYPGRVRLHQLPHHIGD